MGETKEPTCPLCGAANPVVREEVQVRDIDALYRKTLGFGVLDEFAGSARVACFHCRDCDLTFFFPAVAGSAGFYGRLQHHAWYYAGSKVEYTYAGRFIKPTDHVLDVGSGWGAFSNHIAAEHYTGLELNDDAVRLAAERGIPVIRASIEEHASRYGAAYDAVCLFQVLEHVAPVRSFLHHCVACLKSGGLLIVSVPSADSFVTNAYNNILNIPPHHVTRWTDRCLSRVADLFRLEVVELHAHAVEDVHVEWYAHTLGYHALRVWTGKEHRLIDRSFSNRVMGKGAALMSRVLRRGVQDVRMRPRGHTVTVVYRKVDAGAVAERTVR